MIWQTKLTSHASNFNSFDRDVIYFSYNNVFTFYLNVIIVGITIDFKSDQFKYWVAWSLVFSRNSGSTFEPS